MLTQEKKYDEYVRDQVKWYGSAIANDILQYSQDRAQMLQIIEALEFKGFEFSSMYHYFDDQKDFSAVAPWIEHLASFGISLDSISVTDEPEHRMKQVAIKLLSESRMNFCFILSKDAECKIVEIGREPQPDRIKYRIECPREISITSTELLDNDDLPSGADDEIPY